MLFHKNNLTSTPKSMNIHHNRRNIHTILHTLNTVYNIKTMNNGYYKYTITVLTFTIAVYLYEDIGS